MAETGLEFKHFCISLFTRTVYFALQYANALFRDNAIVLTPSFPIPRLKYRNGFFARSNVGVLLEPFTIITTLKG
jgi:hypothetical protein